MRKKQFPLILIGILVLGIAVAGLLGLILAALGLGIAYAFSLRVHPRMRHTGFRGCDGTGEHRGAVFTWVHRRCGRCQGGRIIRFGAGHWGAGHIQGEYTRAKAAKTAAKENDRWR